MSVPNFTSSNRPPNSLKITPLKGQSIPAKARDRHDGVTVRTGHPHHLTTPDPRCLRLPTTVPITDTAWLLRCTVVNSQQQEPAGSRPGRSPHHELTSHVVEHAITTNPSSRQYLRCQRPAPLSSRTFCRTPSLLFAYSWGSTAQIERIQVFLRLTSTTSCFCPPTRFTFDRLTSRATASSF